MSTEPESINHALEQRLAVLEATVERLAQENASLRGQHQRPADTAPVSALAEPVSRRTAFTRIGGVALGAAAVYGVSQATPAAAASTTMKTELDNPVVGKTSITATDPFTDDVLTVRALSNGDAITGYGGSGTQSAGVWGQAPAGWGVYGSSNTGYAVYAFGRVGVSAFSTTGPPTAGAYDLRDIIGDSVGNLYCCIQAGSPGKWRQLNPSVLQFHPVSPFRAYDSRAAQPLTGPIAVGATRVVSVADARDINTGAVTAAGVVPVGASAITYNLTVANTATAGFLAITAGDATSFTASAINWTTPKDQVANGGVVPISTNRDVKIWQGGGGGTDFIVDVTGYYLAT